MYKNLRWKLLLILAVIALAVIAIVVKKISLGLDLQGGLHLVLQVKTDDAVRVETETTSEQFKNLLKDESIPATVKVTALGEFVVENIPPANDTRVRQLSDQQLTRSYDRSPGVGGSYSFKMRPSVMTQTREGSVQQAQQTIERRVNELGVSEPLVSSYGGGAGDQIIVQLPGIKDPARAQEVIKNTAMLEIKLVVAGPATDQATLLSGHNNTKPDDMDIVTGASERGAGKDEFYLVEHASIINGNDLRTARQIVDNVGAPAVGFTLKAEGSVKFGRATSANVNKFLAIILDGRVVSAPRVLGPITQPDAEITGQFTIEQANDLALVLRSGALPASLTYLEKREVGPSLGRDSIRAGIIAAIAGLTFVAVFMVFYYRLAGINALVSVAMNLLILLGFMAQVGAVMTLPGIAGFILTIGMGVDSNVLIFERIREELALKKGVRLAIANAFDRVFKTILDTHIASLISAAFLFQFGTGPIRGFATTLFFGLLSNVFTAVFVSRTLFEFNLSRRPAATTLSV